MYTSVAEDISKEAAILIKCGPSLDNEDKSVLRLDAPRYLRRVQINLKFGKKPLDGLDGSEKRVLLAYVVYLRQNIATKKGDGPNEEDAALIMHGDVYKSGKKELDEDLISQLRKVGVDIPDDDKEGEKK